MISNPSIEVQTLPVDRPSVPAWFAEVVMLSQHLTTKGLLEAFAHQVRLVRGRFGSYEPLDFLVVLIGYAIVLPLAQMSKHASPPPRPPRAVRSHYRWSWCDRLARNAWWGPPQQRITVAGVPAFLALK